jgi:hypothetical protein
MIALSVFGQSDSSVVASPERMKELAAQINRKNSTPQARAKIAAEKARAQASAKASRERWIASEPVREAARAAIRERARREFEANQKSQLQAQQDYQKALPFLMEAQRQQLERLSAFERNVALNRMAAANESIARALGMESVRRANAALGYDTPYFSTFGVNGQPVGPYGGMAFPTPGNGLPRAPSPYDGMFQVPPP